MAASIGGKHNNVMMRTFIFVHGYCDYIQSKEVYGHTLVTTP